MSRLLLPTAPHRICSAYRFRRDSIPRRFARRRRYCRKAQTLLWLPNRIAARRNSATRVRYQAPCRMARRYRIPRQARCARTHMQSCERWMLLSSSRDLHHIPFRTAHWKLGLHNRSDHSSDARHRSRTVFGTRWMQAHRGTDHPSRRMWYRQDPPPPVWFRFAWHPNRLDGAASRCFGPTTRMAMQELRGKRSIAVAPSLCVSPGNAAAHVGAPRFNSF